MEILRTEEEINEQIDIAYENIIQGLSKFPNMTYEEGIKYFYEWVTGQSNENLLRMIKYLYIRLLIKEGDREHTHHCLYVSKLSLKDAAKKFAANYWGESEWDEKNQCWYACGGDIAISISKVEELTEREYTFLKNVLFSD